MGGVGQLQAQKAEWEQRSTQLAAELKLANDETRSRIDVLLKRHQSEIEALQQEVRAVQQTLPPLTNSTQQMMRLSGQQRDTVRRLRIIVVVVVVLL